MIQYFKMSQDAKKDAAANSPTEILDCENYAAQIWHKDGSLRTRPGSYSKRAGRSLCKDKVKELEVSIRGQGKPNHATSSF